MKHITRIFSLLLVMALVFAVAPGANAFTLDGKSAAPADAQLPLPGTLEAGGSAPTLNASDPEAVPESEPNNNASQADIMQLGSIITGQTSSSDVADYFKFTLTKDSDILFLSASDRPTMIFGLFTTDADLIVTCDYYGMQDGLYIDAIAGTLKAGTYYLLVEQVTIDGYTAYSAPLNYALNLHVHDYTVTESLDPTCTAAGYKTYACGCTEEIPMLGHNPVKGESVPPTCTDYGYTSYNCSRCPYSTTDDFVDPLGHIMDEETLTPDTEAKKHSFTCTRCEETATEPCSFEEDPDTGVYYCAVCGADAGSTVFRISGKTRIQTSMAIADTLKEELNIAKFDAIIVASSANFPDALTGSYLAAVKNAPILLTNDEVHADVVSYITLNMDYDGTVYILGGTGAVSQDFEDRMIELSINYKRLSGKTRLETNLAILAEAGVAAGQDVLVCTANGFADSLSASATGLPMLLVQDTLTEEQQLFLSQTAGDLIIIGGSGAVSAELEAELSAFGTTERLSGANRYATSTLVAERFFPAPSSVVLAYAQNYPDGLCGGPLAYTMKAPLILTDGNSSWAGDYMAWRDIEGGYVLGGNILVEDNTVRSLFDMEANEPIPKKR